MREGAGYFIYAVRRFGWINGTKRWFRGYGNPFLIPARIHDHYKKWKLIDRRSKSSRACTVFAVDRDGDLYIVECPNCHNFQTLSRYRWQDDEPCNQCGVEDTTHFHCYMCSKIGFSVYLEDGLREIYDHRKGNTPVPTKVVCDDKGCLRLGIERDAPWWWGHREIYRDFNNGMDAHGHKPYEIWYTDQNIKSSDELTEKAGITN